MKICHISTVHQLFDIRIYHKECITLFKAGHEITLISQHNKSEIVDGIKIIALQKSQNRFQRILLLSLKAFWAARKEKADVYHFHDPELLAIGVLLKIFTGKAVIYDVHEDYSKQILSKYYIHKALRKYLALIVKSAEWLSSKSFDAIIAATDDILKNFSNHQRAISVKNYPIISKFSSIITGNNDNEVFKLIYTGGLTNIRGITQIVSALEFINSNKKVRLTICGKFDSSEYESEVKKLEGFKKVNYLGWLSYDRVTELLAKSNVGVVCILPEPNYINSMPNKLFEYMAAGLPVVASNFPLWKDIVEKCKCGICVDPLKPEEIGRAIQYLIDHPAITKEMAENGRKAFLEKYNWEVESKKLLSLYKDLVTDN